MAKKEISKEEELFRQMERMLRMARLQEKDVIVRLLASPGGLVMGTSEFKEQEFEPKDTPPKP